MPKIKLTNNEDPDSIDDIQRIDLMIQLCEMAKDLIIEFQGPSINHIRKIICIIHDNLEDGIFFDNEEDMSLSSWKTETIYNEYLNKASRKLKNRKRNIIESQVGK